MRYKILTSLIILLSKLRKRSVPLKDMVLRKERDEHNLIAGYWISKDRGIIVECCDCGLGHRFYEDSKGTHALPERPKGYDYKLRFGS